MARKPRIEYEGAVYHIMSRGDSGEAIAMDNTDRVRFMECLGEVCSKTGWRIHAFCLMNNHYHLLCETPEANLVTGMKWLQSVYSIRYNTRHRRHGHVFQGRYKALLVDPENDGYFGTVSTYIHLNPARAGLAGNDKRLIEYRWSSYPLYLRPKSKRPSWLETERVMGDMGIQNDTYYGRKRYKEYLEERVSLLQHPQSRKVMDAEWQSIRRGWYLGSEEFRDQLIDRLGYVISSCRRGSHDGEAVRTHDEAAAQQMLNDGLQLLGITNDDLATLPKNAVAKSALAWVIRKQTTMTNAWISDKLQMGHISNVSNCIRRFDLTDDKQHRQLKARLGRF